MLRTTETLQLPEATNHMDFANKYRPPSSMENKNGGQINKLSVHKEGPYSFVVRRWPLIGEWVGIEGEVGHDGYVRHVKVTYLPRSGWQVEYVAHLKREKLLVVQSGVPGLEPLPQ